MTSSDAQSGGTPSEPRRRGRRRSPAIDSAILTASVDLLIQHGYHGFTVTDVAARASVSEPSIYLRYPSKFDLALAAIMSLPVFETVGVEGRTTYEQLLDILSRAMIAATQLGATVLGSVLAAFKENPELLDAWRQRVHRHSVELIHEVFERGVRAGDLRSDFDVALAADLLATAHLSYFIARGSPGPHAAGDVLEVIWRGLARVDGPRRPPSGRSEGY